MKKKLLMLFWMTVADVHSALPTAITGVTIDSNNIIGSGQSIFLLIVNATLGIIVVVVVVMAMKNVVGALGEAREKNDYSILWKSIGTSFVAIIVIFALMLFVNSLIA